MMNVQLKQVSYNDQLILTTEQIAEFYETTVDTIKVNFNNNKSKFEEGKHYYLLKGDKLKQFRLQVKNLYLQISPMTRSLYLWTKRGASRHAKMLGTDRAWDVYDELEETYFNVRKLLEIKDKENRSNKRLEIMERNSATRRAQLMYKIAMETKNPRYKEELLYQASKEIAGDMEFVSEDASGEYFGMFYTATQIANIAGLPNGAMIVGRIANQYHIKPFYGTENKYSRIMITPDGIQQTIYKTPGKDKILEILENEGYI